MKRFLLAISLGCLASLSSLAVQAATNHKPAVQKTKKSVVKAHIRSQAGKIVAAKPSYGQIAGLHATADDLDLKSSVAYVIDQDTHEVLLSKNDRAVLPIASITKLVPTAINKISEATRTYL